MRNELAGGEPEFTIYGLTWDAARVRVASLSSEHTRREHGALLDYVESGWAYLRPLQLQAETEMARGDKSARCEDAVCVADYVDASVTDEFREFAITRRDAVGTNPRVLQAVTWRMKRKPFSGRSECSAWRRECPIFHRSFADSRLTRWKGLVAGYPGSA